MKSLLNKTLAAFVLVILMLGIRVETAVAASPHVIIKVQTESGSPVEGATVRWTDNYNSYMYQTTTGGSYKVIDELGDEFTVSAGQALFRSWDLPPEKGGFPDRSNTGPQFDHDLNSSTPTIPQWQVSDLAAEKGRFGCNQNDHTFVATPPPNSQLICDPIVETMMNAPTTNTFTITCKKTAAICPGNIKQISCDQTNKTVTVGWNSPPGGADGYRAYFDAEPVGVPNNLDILNTDLSNQLRRTQVITFGQRYLLRLKSLKTVDGQSLESESCFAEIMCKSTPPLIPVCDPATDPKCCDPATDSTCQDPKLPSAELSGKLCPDKPSPYYYDYTMSNVDTKGNQFLESKYMITFIRNAQTKQILDYLNDASANKDIIPDALGFSRWNELNRTPIDGDYFGFYVKTFTTQPSGVYKLDDSVKIGNHTIGELRDFLDQNNFPTQFKFKANMATKFGTSGVLFNSDIPGGTISLAKDLDEFCGGTQCDPALACLSTIQINPIENPLVPTVSGGKETITLSWSSNSAGEETEYEAMLSGLSSPQVAYENYLKFGNSSKVMVLPATTFSQTFDITDMPRTLTFAVRAKNTSCSLDIECDWVSQQITLGFEVSGRFIPGSSCLVNPNNVSLPGSSISPGGTLTNSDQGYSITLPYSEDGNTVSLQIAGPDYVCTNGLSCPTGGGTTTCSISNVNEASTEKHFFVQSSLSQYSSWWQVRGGLVYGERGITSMLPIINNQRSEFCVGPDCEPFLIRREYKGSSTNLSNLSAGIPIVNAGGFNSAINGWWTHRGENEGDPQPHAEGTTDMSVGDNKENFAFFERLLANEVDVTANPGTITDSIPNGKPVGDANVLLFEGDLHIKPTSTLPVTGKKVILVKGNIYFETEGVEKLTSVAPGNFLAFVASKNIIFDNEVGTQTPNTSTVNINVEGVFIADENIIIQSNGSNGGDKQFVGAGSFIGWKNVDLQRHFDNPNDITDSVNQEKNTNMPVENFIFRPDFVVNAPEFMRSSSFTWKEVN